MHGTSLSLEVKQHWHCYGAIDRNEYGSELHNARIVCVFASDAVKDNDAWYG